MLSFSNSDSFNRIYFSLRIAPITGFCQGVFSHILDYLRNAVKGVYPMLKITRKNTLLLGTLILTASGIICRILGFLYRIFLSRRIGAEAFGIYQLATPLYALMLSLGAGGMQTVLSRFVASYLAKKDSRRAKICLAAGCGIVVILSFSASIFLFFSADFIGTRLLFEPRTILLLRILSLGILPSGIHNCLSAWYLGQNQTALPSFCQLLEQFVRMALPTLPGFSVFPQASPLPLSLHSVLPPANSFRVSF